MEEQWSLIPDEIMLVDSTSGQLRGHSLYHVAAALTRQVREHFGPAWLAHGQSPSVVVGSEVPDSTAGDMHWYIELVEDLGDDEEAGFHQWRVVIDPQGVPVLVPFARVGLIQAKRTANRLKERFHLTDHDIEGIWSVVVSHELLEMLADPLGNYYSDPVPPPDGFPGAPSPRRVVYLLEVCDPCPTSVYEINGVKVSDFVRPQYFQVSFSQGDPDTKPIKPEEPLGILTFRLFDDKDEPLWFRYYKDTEWWPRKQATLETTHVPKEHLPSLVKPAFDGTGHPSAASTSP